MRLDGKTALITGAGSGIGREAALAFAAAGAQMLLSDIDQAGLEVTREQINKVSPGTAVQTLVQDVRSEDAWITAIQTVKAVFGGLDILVNNAGIGSGQRVVDMSLEAWNNQLAINLTGVFLGCKHAIPLMQAGGQGGSIINISSVAGLEGSAGLAGYCATKGGVRLFTKAVAKEYALDKIRCNSVHPGMIDTPIWGKIDEGGLAGAREVLGIDAGANMLPVSAMAVITPMQRPGMPAEIAQGILFLASEASSYMTGSELVIDGGLSA